MPVINQSLELASNVYKGLHGSMMKSSTCTCRYSTQLNKDTTSYNSACSFTYLPFSSAQHYSFSMNRLSLDVRVYACCLLMVTQYCCCDKAYTSRQHYLFELYHCCMPWLSSMHGWLVHSGNAVTLHAHSHSHAHIAYCYPCVTVFTFMYLHTTATSR
jgi:hypothetical protein